MIPSRKFEWRERQNKDGTFTAEDYQKIARAEQIRNVSDYDDFYIASKEEAGQQVKNAEYLIGKINTYIARKA